MINPVSDASRATAVNPRSDGCLGRLKKVVTLLRNASPAAQRSGSMPEPLKALTHAVI